MQKHFHRGAYTALATTKNQPQGYDNPGSVSLLRFEDEVLQQPSSNLISAPQQHSCRSWQHKNNNINAQELSADCNKNTTSKFTAVTTTAEEAKTETKRQKHAWRNKRLYSSCTNLNNTDRPSTSGSTGNSYSAEFDHMGTWRESTDVRNQMYTNAMPGVDMYEYNSRIHSDSDHANVTNSHCDVGNCGKILWISRDSDGRFGRQSRTTFSGLRLDANTDLVHGFRRSQGFIVRTNAQGLPYTPLPHQRQAYLANQHAIEAAIPLVVNGITSEPRSKSPNRYVESNVNIHYKTPIRYENKEPISENELAMRQAEQMQKLYQEERRRKYLQELQDMNARRHTDNFPPSQKSPILLNRYDDFQSNLAPKSPNAAMGPKIISRALYNFQGQTARELSFRKGDVIYIRREIDKNWYEGEHNAMVGLLPSNYVEIISRDGVRQPARKVTVGQARAKYNFHAQSGIELSLNKGELVTLTRRVDDNWFEGKIANRKGIFPVSYVEVINDIGRDDISTSKAIISSSNTTDLHPSLDKQRTIDISALNAIPRNHHQPANGVLRETRNILKTDILHVDTSTDSKIYRAIYKYRPQNSDELELQEGDIVHVLEKCDDGWFVGTSQRTSCFGTFPGNYVERA